MILATNVLKWKPDVACARTRGAENILSQPLVAESSEAYDGRKNSFNKTTVKIRNELHIKRGNGSALSDEASEGINKSALERVSET